MMENNKFRHVVITRFNVRTVAVESVQDKNSRPVLTKEWMKDRFELFETYYLSSMSGQTNKNFVCVVYFDERTDQEFKERLVALQNKYKFLNVKYVADDGDMGRSLDKDVRSFCGPDTKYVITSRIDNDDGYHCRAIERIQREFKPIDCLAVNLYKGYRYIIGDKKILLKNRFVNGPFISLIEDLSKDKLLTAINGQHHTFYRRFKTKQVGDDYYWLQTLHDSNLANDISGIPSLDEKKLPDFGISNAGIKFSTKMYWQCFRMHFFNIKNYIPHRLKIWLLKKLKKIQE